MLKDLFFNLGTTFFRLFEWLRVLLFYYTKNLYFVWTDFLFALLYLFKSPHRHSKQFQLKKGAKNPYTYGETPLTTLDRIAREGRIVSKDCVYELGCGSGRTCFWLAQFIGCRVFGIDYHPQFIQKANWIKNHVKELTIEFSLEDMFKTNLKRANVIYLYGTCLEDEEIQRLLLNFKQLAPKTRIITVSYPLTDFSEQGEYRILSTFKGRFPWGSAEIFINEKINSCVSPELTKSYLNLQQLSNKTRLQS